MPRLVFRRGIPACVLALATFGWGGLADAAWTFKRVYSFQGGNDGAQPLPAVVETGGKLYGTTALGGGPGCGNTGCGTVFRLTTTGKEKVLASFGISSGGYDGNTPRAPLLNVSGTLYGTTEEGGIGDGVIFSITPAGTENTLHTFQGGSSDGGLPFGGLIKVNGTLYGTTAGGGGYGTVYSITPTGNENIVYDFKGASAGDGSAPEAGVINVKGTLYGTTFGGGKYSDGTVFKVTLSGDETVLHSFEGGSDGNSPFAALTNVDGTLYGTTLWGGGTGCGGRGCGTVFKITRAGKETVVYRFQGGSDDGANPEANLLNVNGTLYGTTRVGGAAGCGTDGCGTVFEVTPTGAVNIIHVFQAAEGYWPQAGLIDVGGTLYGTTTFGGSSTNCAGGCGSVFALSQ
jgi:uncharacterized repeat protein (TIGR03803 family)